MSICLFTEVKRHWVGDRFSALLMSLMALWLALADRNPSLMFCLQNLYLMSTTINKFFFFFFFICRQKKKVKMNPEQGTGQKNWAKVLPCSNKQL